MSKYTKSLSTDFGGNLHRENLLGEINASVNIAPKCCFVSGLGDVVDIIFETPLSVTEQTELDTIISAHNSQTEVPKTQFFIVHPETKDIYWKEYTLSAKFKFPGTDYSGDIDYIEVLANMDEEVTSYAIRIVNASDFTILAEVTGLTNTETAVHDLGVISNVPAEECIIDVFVKRAGGDDGNGVHVDQITVYHGN